MKSSVLSLVLLSFLFSCKVSDSITVDSVSNTEKLKGYQTFQLIDEDYSDKRNERLKLAFRDKLIDYGFEESSENPDFLIQSVLVTRRFIQEFGHYSSIPGPFYSAINSGNRSPGGGTKSLAVNRGMIGKVIFLIQDTKSNEIAWMGIGTGVISGGGSQINPEDLDIALYELMATLNP